MRIPSEKVYRAFAELDGFGDEQCEGYVRRAAARHPISMVLAGIVAVTGAVATGVGLAFGEVMVTRLIVWERYREWLLYHAIANALTLIVLISLPLGGALIAGLLVRDGWLRWAIGRELLRSTCPTCEYQLLGLPAREGIVRCPECGLETRLEMVGVAASRPGFVGSS